MFPTIFDVKNANKVQKKFFLNSIEDTMTHFNIFIAIKRRRDNNNNKQRKRISL